MDTNDIIKIDFSHFPEDERFVQIPGKLVMIDNFLDENNQHRKHEHQNFPVQVTMSVSFLCLKGGMEINIDLDSYTIKPNQNMFILPGSFFQIKKIEPETKGIFMAISSDFISYTNDIKLGIELGREFREHPIQDIEESELENIISLYKMMSVKLKDKSYMFKEEIARSYINIIKCNVFQKFMDQSYMKKEQKPSNRKEEIFIKFLQTVRENYKMYRNIGFYADLLFMSPKYLSSVVHEVSGKYATEWINDFVILEAKAMLRTTGKSVKDVTNSLNFANQSFFAKYFKQHTGYTPREYMNM